MQLENDLEFSCTNRRSRGLTHIALFTATSNTSTTANLVQWHTHTHTHTHRYLEDLEHLYGVVYLPLISAAADGSAAVLSGKDDAAQQQPTLSTPVGSGNPTSAAALELAGIRVVMQGVDSLVQAHRRLHRCLTSIVRRAAPPPAPSVPPPRPLGHEHGQEAPLQLVERGEQTEGRAQVDKGERLEGERRRQTKSEHEGQELLGDGERPEGGAAAATSTAAADGGWVQAAVGSAHALRTGLDHMADLYCHYVRLFETVGLLHMWPCSRLELGSLGVRLRPHRGLGALGPLALAPSPRSSHLGLGALVVGLSSH